MEGVADLIRRHAVADLVTVSGHPSWSHLRFTDARGYSQWQIRTLFLQEIFARGVLSLGTHNMSYAHTDEDIERLLAVYDEVFPILGEAAASGRLMEQLRCAPLQPLFRAR